MTIIDFWGDWCTTCKKKLPTLIAFQQQNIDTVALRRVEVPDFDAPVAEQHMPTISGLPHVWVFDKKGVRRHVLSGMKQVDTLQKLVRNLLAEP